LTTSGGNVNCDWKPTSQGTVSITASIFQGGVYKSSTPVLTLSTTRRTGLR
jgi:hypothetical protein